MYILAFMFISLSQDYTTCAPIFTSQAADKFREERPSVIALSYIMIGFFLTLKYLLLFVALGIF